MPIVIPLIRGFALFPTLHWLAEHGVVIDQVLRGVDLPTDLVADPFRPVPFVHVVTLLRNAARDFGPDLPCRIVSETSNLELAMLGKVALGTRTPGEALARLVAALPYYCSHEQVSVQRKPGTYVVSEFFAHRFDPEAQHTVLQYAAAMVHRIVGLAGDPPPRFQKLEIPAHPTHGVKHLRRWFGEHVFETRSRAFTAMIDERIMHRPFSTVARDRLKPRAVEGTISLRGDGTLASSVRSLLVFMLESDEAPTMKRVVAAAGTSARTFQRQLDVEGVSFSELLAQVRRSETLKRLKEGDNTIASIAADLGYSDQAAFTRAFRRWTGSPPGQFRARAT